MQVVSEIQKIEHICQKFSKYPLPRDWKAYNIFVILSPEVSYRLMLLLIFLGSYWAVVSVNSKPDHTPGRSPGIRTFPLPEGSAFRPTFFARWREGLNERHFIVFKEKCRNFLICSKETGGSLKSRSSGAVLCRFL